MTDHPEFADWFNPPPVLGQLSLEEAGAKLREVGEDTAADALEEAATRAPGSYGPSVLDRVLGRDPRARLYMNTAHAFGHLAPAPPGDKFLPIRHAGNIEPEAELRGGRVRITLNALRVAAYPGGGIHRVLFDFYGRHQAADTAEDLRFNATFRVQEGQRAAILGYPIFVGLGVGTAGIAFRCFTVNVKNDDDERLLGFLESDVFRAGLQLATTAQPAIAPLAGMARGLTEMVAKRHRNVPVQDFYLGLDFDQNPAGARLATGSYLAVQIPEAMQAVWQWDDWAFNPGNGLVVNRVDPAQLIPYNYVVFGVSRYEGP